MESRSSPDSEALTIGAEVWCVKPSNRGLGPRPRLRDLRPLRIDRSHPKVTHHDPGGPVRLGLILGRHAVTWAMATTTGMDPRPGWKTHRIAPGIAGTKAKKKSSRQGCGELLRAARGEREEVGVVAALDWRGVAELACWARRRRQVPSLWFGSWTAQIGRLLTRQPPKLGP